METMFNKKTLAASLVAAFFGMMSASSLVLADETASMPAAEPAAAEEPAAEEEAAPATEEETTAEEAAPAEEAEPAAE